MRITEIQNGDWVMIKKKITRIKSFYRHNKHFGGMWGCVIVLITTITPPYGVVTAFLFVLLGFVGIMWAFESRAYNNARIALIAYRKYYRLLKEHKETLEKYQYDLNDSLQVIKTQNERNQELIKKATDWVYNVAPRYVSDAGGYYKMSVQGREEFLKHMNDD